MDRRRYTREFKIEAVKLVRGGLPFDQVLGLQAQEPSWPTNGLPPNYLPQANIDGIDV